MDEKEKIKAILDRDSRYDEVFWYGVKSTGIVCKPSCSAKIPLLKNIELFDRVEDAIKSGYRPCKICMKVMKEKNTIKIKRYESPCGVLMLGSFGDKLCLCDWQVEKHRDHVDRRLKRILNAEFEEGTSEVIGKAERQLDEFFAGQQGVRHAAAVRGYGFPENGVERIAENPVRADDFLRRDGTKNRHARSCACGCQRQRSQFDVYFRSLSPRHR